MLRKVKKSCAFHEDQDYETCAALVKALVEKLIHLDILNDDTYTRVKLRALRQRGKSKRAIVNYLKAKGIAGDLVQKHWSLYNQEHDIEEDEAEYETAIIFARKKRLGPFKISDKITPEQALGRLARAGFSYDTARRVLNLENDDF
jgi:regulatory protein